MVITSSTGNVNFTTPSEAVGDVASISLLSQDTLENGYTAKIVPQAYYSTSRTFTLPDDSGTVALTKNVVSSFNGRTGSIQGVSAAVAGTGISVSGATGSVTITNTGVRSLNGFTGTVTITGGTGISVTSSIAGITIGLTSLIQGATGATGPQGNTGPVGDYVVSFNGLTGAVTGITAGGANTFTALNSFSAGLSASGATFSGDIAVNGGDITTTSATATLYNTTATTVNIGNAASTVNLMGATANTQTGIGSMCYVKTGQTSTTTTAKQEIFRYPTVTTSTADRYFADIIVTANYGNIVSGSIGSQITKMLVATSYNTAINHTEYGNVNTSGNLAVYTAEISGNNVIIYATPTNGFTTVFNVYATLIKGSYGLGTED